MTKIKRALISVSDKSGVADFAKKLANAGVEIISTGGTARLLAESGVEVVKVSDITNFPEILGGRVKTLHPQIHGGLLGVRDNDAHVASMQEHGITAIDLLVINLYPFEETVAKGASFEECVEQIDIGGPAMIRAGAKNHKFVTVVTDSADYESVLSEMATNDGATTASLRRKLATKAFTRTAQYDTAISNWLKSQI